MGTAALERRAPVSLTATVARFEFRTQARELLSGIYVSVFFLLTFAYTSSHVLELVSNRAGLPKNAPLILAEVMAGVTAFGAVITTMIASTAALRDVALRTEALVLTTRLTAREYVLGRFAGALGVMLLVYAAIPLGLAIGTIMPWATRSELVPFDLAAYARPMAVLVLPNVLTVAALFFAVGTLAKNFFAILLTAVGVVTLWQLGLTLGRASETATIGALLDPFGNAALALATHGITGVARGAAALPLAPVLLLNRALWLAIAGSAMWVTLRRFRFTLAPAVRGEAIAVLRVTSPRTKDDRAPQFPSVLRTQHQCTEASFGRQIMVEAGFTFVSTLGEKGFVALAVLAVLNGATNAWGASAASSSAEADVVLRAISEHTRLFFILIATIWAGELVWRERDLRVDGLLDALPTRVSANVIGKLLGVHGAQLTLVALLGLLAFVLPRLRGAPQAPSAMLTIGWCAMALFPAVVLLTQMSLAVHALVQNKAAGHVLCISAWVAAVAIGANGGSIELLAIRDVPALASVAGSMVSIDWITQTGEVAFNVARGSVCTLVAIAAWSRGTPGRRARSLGQKDVL